MCYRLLWSGFPHGPVGGARRGARRRRVLSRLRFREAAPVALRAVWALRGAAGWAAKTQKLGLRWLRRYGWLAFPSSSRRLVDPLEAQLPFWGRKNGFYGKTASAHFGRTSRYLCSRAAGYTFIEHCIECYKSCGPKTPSYTQPVATTTAVSLSPRAVVAHFQQPQALT